MLRCTPNSGPAPRSGSGPCSCCPRSPTPRASTVPDAEVDAEVARGRERYPDDARLQEYFGTERGRSYIRSTLRRSRVVEGLIDEWLADHPDHPPLPHLEDGPASAIEGEQATANAAVDATDPGSILDDVPAAAG